MPKGMREALAPINPVAWKNRLLEACAVYHAAPTFKPGDILTHNPALYPDQSIEEAYGHGIAPLVVVIETRPSWRDLSSREESTDMPPDCQAIFIGQFDSSGLFITTWTGSVFFLLAPELPINPKSAVVNLNH